jgi:ribosomal protein L18
MYLSYILIKVHWLLICKLVQIKHSSMNLAKMYIKRVSLELDSIRNLDRESSQESLLLQGVQFAYRAHQVIIKSAVYDLHD